MKVIIIGGFLGSGKTTLLMKLVPSVIENLKINKGNGFSETEYLVVILENEISETDTDSRMLRSMGLTVRNLPGGCICCTSKIQLSDSLNEIHEKYHPDYLFTEATGMAYPDAILQTVREAGYDGIVFTLVDAKRWPVLRKAMPDFVVGQLRESTTVLINKIDLIAPDTLQEISEDIRSLLSEMENQAAILPVCLSESLPGELLQYICGPAMQINQMPEG